MKLILVMVMSVDGKTTKGNNPQIASWTSSEDKKYFSQLIGQATCTIMGRKTFDAAKNFMTHTDKKLRVVMTSNPSKYKTYEIPNVLEFSSSDPTVILEDLYSRRYSEVFLLGGENLNYHFLKKNLVDELWLTVEPIILGTGNGLAGVNKLESNLQLLSSKKLNKEGTLLLKYSLS